MKSLNRRLRQELSPWRPQHVDASYELFSQVRARHGLSPSRRLSSTLALPDAIKLSNKKFAKTADELGIGVGGRTLQQWQTTDIVTCPWATPACKAACLGMEGNFKYPKVAAAKVARTEFEYEFPHHAWSIYDHEIRKDTERTAKLGIELYWRPDTLSDSTLWDIIPEFFDRHPSVTFYGYTKAWRLMSEKNTAGWVGNNYRVALSASEKTSDNLVKWVLNRGFAVAMVFAEPPGDTWNGFPVVDGTKDDTWMIAHPSTIIGALKPIGHHMAADTSGFVRTPVSLTRKESK